MNDYESAVFVSYAWGGDSERTVDELEQAFARRGIRIVRDKKDLGYKGSIEEFERRIGLGQSVILVISDKYLRSEHCMHELVEIGKNQNLRNRIFPIVLADAHIYKAVDRLDYIQYWDVQIKKLNQAVKKINVMANLAGVMADLDKYARIRASFDHLTELLKDMNALTPDLLAADGFARLVDAVQQQMAQKQNENAGDNTNQQYHPQANGSRNISVNGNVNGNIIIGDNNTVSANPYSSTDKTGKHPKAANSKHIPLSVLEQLRQPGEIRRQLVNALLECDSMANHDQRQQVVSQLPKQIRNIIGESNAGSKIHVDRIVQTCSGYENGIQNLISAIEFFEEDSVSLQNVRKLLGMG